MEQMPEFIAEAGICLLSVGLQAKAGDYEVGECHDCVAELQFLLWWSEEAEVAPAVMPSACFAQAVMAGPASCWFLSLCWGSAREGVALIPPLLLLGVLGTSTNQGNGVLRYYSIFIPVFSLQEKL